MPFFKVLVQGKNLRSGGAGNEQVYTGFFTTRFVLAPNLTIAESKAVFLVRKLWLTPEYVNKTGPSGLQLTVSQSGHCSAWQWLTAHNKGHTFYEKDS